MSHRPPVPLTISYPEDLPVSGRRDDILAALRDHQVVIVAGATGSGKTTQLPKMLLELGKRRIAHTQPRRIAARAVAERVAEELGTELGGLVGYRVRFTDQASRDSRLIVMTDGILLNEIHRDPDLRRYDAIIIDEAHERSLTVDFLLGYLRRLLPRRPDLTVVVTSATIDPESFARHFARNADPAPVIEVSGRTYPVEIRYRPLVPDTTPHSPPDPTPDDRWLPTSAGEAQRPPAEVGNHQEVSEARDTVTGVLDALAELERESPGDVLVFLSGEGEIRDVLDAVVGAQLPGTEVLPLYGRLSAAEQHRVFQTSRAPGIRRRVILATNVAETSLTVPGIRYVIDEGTARISRWSARSKVQRLPIEPVSQASAAQRAGRSGRVAPGVAIRLYSETDFAKRPEFTEPEILRTDLAAVLLQMAVLGLGDIEAFPFIDPPDKRGVRDGLALLAELGAIDASGSVTRLGRELSRLPLDPRLGRMLLAARELDVIEAVLPIVAGLSVQDPRERPEAAREQADLVHRRHVDPTSDFMTLLRLWRHLEEQQAALSGSAFRRMLKTEYLSYLRIREWQDVVRQLRFALDLPRNATSDGPPTVDADRMHQAILAGLLSRIGIRDDRDEPAPAGGARRGSRRPGQDRRRHAEYLGSRGSRFTIHPASALARRAPEAVMSAELVETSRLFARMNAAIDPAWAERWAGDLLVRSVAEPRWDPRRGEAVADEKVLLYGVPIIPRRRIRFARIDPGYAHELFLRHALVAGEWDVSRVARHLTTFHRRNAELRERLEDLQDRERRRDLLLGEEALVAWYRARVPERVDSTREFERWWRREHETQPDLLTMREEDFLDPDAVHAASLDEGYPERWTHCGLDFELDYLHAPGAPDDGVTLIVPVDPDTEEAQRAALDQIDAAAIEWLVPGMREELVAGWIKTLPKVLRREVVPAGDWARRIVPELPGEPEGRFGDVLAATIKRLTFAPVTRHDFELARLPEHLRMNVRLVDARGKTLAAGRDLAALRARLRPAADHPAQAPHSPHPPDAAHPGAAQHPPRVRPGAEGATSGAPPRHVAAPSADRAGAGEPSPAVRALIKYAMDHLTDAERLQLATSPYRSVPALLADCVAVSAPVPPPDAIGHSRTSAAVDPSPDEVFHTVGIVAAILGAAREVDRLIRDTTSLALVAPLRDARAQLDALIHPGFVAIAGLAALTRYPAYLAGLRHRIERLAQQSGRDRVWQGEVEAATALYLEAGGTLPLVPGLDPALVRVRWLLEELRLSRFAQHLPTAEPVSVQRIRRTLAEHIG
ncbi:MAG TPA: ATP-dependent RNA helicase HrpA [Microbacteriaceae bacterium]|nr:ATP-dependent RNA helicase HrpA [Microbacteriaceae bacterium]